MDTRDIIKEKHFCINGLQVCTRNEHLAQIYHSIQRISEREDDAATPWCFILATLPVRLQDFARSRGIADEHLLLSDVRKRFNLAMEVHKMDEDDQSTVRDILNGCVGDLQYMDTHLDADKDAGGEKGEAGVRPVEYPPIEFEIVARHMTQDMSVAGSYEQKLFVPFKDLQEKRFIESEELGVGKIEVLQLSEKQVLLRWGEEEYSLDFGGELSTKYYLVDNPGLSSDRACLVFSYHEMPPYYQALDIISEISDEHCREQKSVYLETTRQEEKALHLLDRAIQEGMVEAYPLKALLAASNNWSSCLIVREGLFRRILLEGIDKGCLAPGKALSWEWLEVAAVNNDPALFMDDMERYYDLLATAAEDGNTIARDLMDAIWEPEQIIEED